MNHHWSVITIAKKKHILLYILRTVHAKSRSITSTSTPYKFKGNWWIRWANWVNSSNFNVKAFRFSGKLDHPFSHSFKFGNMFPESYGFVAMPVTRYMSKFIPIYLVKWDEIVRAFDRHSNETLYIRKYITNYKHMRKWMVEFLRKSESRGIKIDPVNSIRIIKSIILLSVCTVLGSIVMLTFFKLTARALSIYREVYNTQLKTIDRW